MPNWVKMVEAKVALAKRGAKPSKAGDNPRISPGQKQVHDFPVLDLGLQPEVSPSSSNLRVFGLVEVELDYSWKTFNELPQVDLTTDFHQDDRPGFWEVRGYHNEADPWKEQRFAPPEQYARFGL